jgi:DNA-binding GntR family transcriptional regulator
MLNSLANSVRRTESAAMKIEPNQLHRQLAQRILVRARMEQLPPGHHLTESSLQKMFGTSRGPIRAALTYLAARGFLEQRPNRGFYVLNTDNAADVAIAPHANVFDDEQLYLKIAADRLTAGLPESVTEAELMRRYDIQRNRLRRILSRIAIEGWIQRKAGHGWSFLPMIDSVEAYTESYELRQFLEPQGLRSNSFRLDHEALARLKSRQEFLHNTGYLTLGQIELFISNSEFHETIARMSGNRFLAQTVARQNELRRLIEYRQTLDRDRVWRQTGEHLDIIAKLEAGNLNEAATLLDRHIAGALQEKARPQYFSREERSVSDSSEP